MIRAHVLICGGTGCTSSGSISIQKAFEENIAAFDLTEEVKLVQTGCFGLCELGPVVIVYPDGTFYSRVSTEDVKEIVEEHLLKGRPVERLVYNDTGKDAPKVEGQVALSDTAFYKSQNRVVLRNCGVIDPEDIEEYIGKGGIVKNSMIALGCEIYGTVENSVLSGGVIVEEFDGLAIGKAVFQIDVTAHERVELFDLRHSFYAKGVDLVDQLTLELLKLSSIVKIFIFFTYRCELEIGNKVFEMSVYNNISC